MKRITGLNCVDPLTLYALAPQNGQTHSNNSLAVSRRIV